ncbi:hypothetical protein STENM327S_05197 [Streptomyces tendae]
MADGLVEEAGTLGADGGRPRTLVRVAADRGRLVGVDVGETRVRVELFDLSMAELARTERALPGHGSRSYDVGVVAGHILDGVAEVLAAHGPAQGPSELLGVGIGVPGIVERTAEGTLVHGQTVGWDAVPLEALLRRSGRLAPHVPLFIENGARTLGQADVVRRRTRRAQRRGRALRLRGRRVRRHRRGGAGACVGVGAPGGGRRGAAAGASASVAGGSPRVRVPVPGPGCRGSRPGAPGWPRPPAGR